jgi:tetratricopeptide (TPR) repeat protein
MLALVGKPRVAGAGIASALNNLGGVRYKQGEFGPAAECFGESAALAREQGDCYGTGVALHNLASVIYDSGGDLDQASALLEETLAIWDEIGLRQGTATTLSSLGQMALIRGDHAGAARWFAQSLATLPDIGDGRSISLSLVGLGRASYRLGDQPAATRSAISSAWPSAVRVWARWRWHAAIPAEPCGSTVPPRRSVPRLARRCCRSIRMRMLRCWPPRATSMARQWRMQHGPPAKP